MGDRFGDEGEHRRGHFEARMMDAGGGDPALEDFEPQFFAERADLHHKPAGEPRADAVVEAFEVGRRTVAGDHDLAAGVDQGVERVAEFGLGRSALQELQVVDHQHVDGAHRFLEGERGLGPQRRDEAVHEALGRQIEHLAIAAIAGPGNRLQQVRFAETHAGVDVERIEHQRLAAPAGRDLLRRGMRQRVRAADDEGLEREARIERRTAERLVHRHERHAGARVAAVARYLARFARRHRRFGTLGFDRKRTDRGRADAQFQAGDVGSSACQWPSTFSL